MSTRLTRREYQIAAMTVFSGNLYTQTARELGITVGTVRKHMQHAYRKSGATNHVQMLRYMLGASPVGDVL